MKKVPKQTCKSEPIGDEFSNTNEWTVMNEENRIKKVNQGE